MEHGGDHGALTWEEYGLLLRYRELDQAQQEGFRWLECGTADQCVYAFERKAEKERLTAVFNFSGIEQTGLCLKIAGAKKLKEIFSSGNRIRTKGNENGRIESENSVFELELAPFSAEYYLIG